MPPQFTKRRGAKPPVSCYPSLGAMNDGLTHALFRLWVDANQANVVIGKFGQASIHTVLSDFSGFELCQIHKYSYCDRHDYHSLPDYPPYSTEPLWLAAREKSESLC